MANLIHRTPLMNRLARFDPFHDEDWFKGFWMRPFPRMMPFSTEMEERSEIRIDLSENEKAYIVRAEIPGAKKEDVKVHLEGNRVSISADVKRNKEEKQGDKVIYSECFQGSTSRSFTLDSDVDESKAEAKFENGVLELTLPKKTGGAARELQVK